MLKAILFDMDGVLFDTERLNASTLALSAGLDEHAFSDDQWRALLGTNMDDTCRMMNAWFPGQIDREKIIRDWPLVTLDYVRARGVPQKPGAEEALRALRRLGLKTAICTSNERMVAEEYVRIAGWEALFDQIVTADMVLRGKPAPDIYLKGAALLGVSPEECAGVEDSPHGLRAIRDAGMLSVMVPDMVPYEATLAPVTDIHIASLHELIAALGGMLPCR